MSVNYVTDFADADSKDLNFKNIGTVSCYQSTDISEVDFKKKKNYIDAKSLKTEISCSDDVIDYTHVNTSVEQFNILLKDGTFYSIQDEDIEFWKEAYPHVDLSRELKSMNAWCYSNPSRRKTRRGVKRFINSWLNRSENNYHTNKSNVQYKKSYNNPYIEYA